MELDAIEAALCAYFRGRADVAAVYLFGSASRGTAQPRSDVDVAVLYEEAPQSSLTSQPFTDQAKLSELLSQRVDLINLNSAPVDLIHRVLRAQHLLLDQHPGRRIAFEVDARNKYFDLKPLLDLYRRKSA